MENIQIRGAQYLGYSWDSENGKVGMDVRNVTKGDLRGPSD